MISLAHVINPVKVSEESDLFLAQPVTFRTMKKSADNTKNANIILCAASYIEDASIIPNYFIKLPALKRSINDMIHFKNNRKLPLIHDILKSVYDNTESEYIIYTNVDIGLMPNFYNRVLDIIENKYDAFSITRKTLPNEYALKTDNEIFNCKDRKNHQGYDCFVFKKKLFAKMSLGNVCIGINYIGKILIHNLKSNVEKFKIFDSENITFHFGDDRIWTNNINKKLREFNKKEYFKYEQSI